MDIDGGSDFICKVPAKQDFLQQPAFNRASCRGTSNFMIILSVSEKNCAIARHEQGCVPYCTENWGAKPGS